MSVKRRKLLEQVDLIKGKITDDEWETLCSTKPVRYVVQEGDYLWKISQRLFGSGFYYAKVWALNPQITNPHEIEPGMVLVFETGDENLLPTVKMGNFDDLNAFDDKTFKGEIDLCGIRESNTPMWLRERNQLKKTGAFFLISFLSENPVQIFWVNFSFKVLSSKALSHQIPHLVGNRFSSPRFKARPPFGVPIS